MSRKLRRHHRMTVTQARTGPQLTSSAAAPTSTPTIPESLLSRLNDVIRRISSAAFGVHNLANTIVGIAPSDATESPKGVPASLMTAAMELESETAALERAITRLLGDQGR